MLIWVQFSSTETLGIRYGGNCCVAFKCFISRWGLLGSSWFRRSDLPVISSPPDLYNKSNSGIICVASFRVQVKTEQSLWDINEESIYKAEVKCDAFWKGWLSLKHVRRRPLRAGWESVSVFPLTCSWMWTFWHFSKTLHHPQSGKSSQEGEIFNLHFYTASLRPLSSPRNELMCMLRMRTH